MFEVRDDSGRVMSKQTSLGRACDHADVLLIATGEHYTVVEIKRVYSTHECNPKLRPVAEMAVHITEQAVSKSRSIIDMCKRTGRQFIDLPMRGK